MFSLRIQEKWILKIFPSMTIITSFTSNITSFKTSKIHFASDIEARSQSRIKNKLIKEYRNTTTINIGSLKSKLKNDFI